VRGVRIATCGFPMRVRSFAELSQLVEARRVVLDGEDVDDRRGFGGFLWGTDQHGDDEQDGQDGHRQGGQGQRREQGSANEIAADE